MHAWDHKTKSLKLPYVYELWNVCNELKPSKPIIAPYSRECIALIS